MNLLFTLCGRAGSKGVKNKNIKKMLGIPLVYYSLAAIKGTQDVFKDDNIKAVLNTDSEDLINIVGKQDLIDVQIIRRNKELSGDEVSKVDVIKNCYKLSKELYNCDFDYVIDLDITSPLRTIDDVCNAVNKAKESKYDAVFSVTESRRNPYFNMVKKEGEFFIKAFPSNYVARQQAPVFYDMNASIYVYSPKALSNKSTVGFFESNTSAVVMMDTGILDIDSENDFKLIEIISNYLFSSNNSYKILYSYAKDMYIKR